MFESDFLPVPNLKLYSGEWKGTAEMQKAINYPNLSKTPKYSLQGPSFRQPHPTSTYKSNTRFKGEHQATLAI